MAESRAVWSFALDKIAQMLPDNERPGMPADGKVWLKRFSIEAVPGKPGLYSGVIEAGGLLRADMSHGEFARTTFVVSLENDPSGVFKDVKITAYDNKAASLYGGDGPPKFWVMQLRFTVDWKGGRAP